MARNQTRAHMWTHESLELTRRIIRHGENKIAARLGISSAEVCRKVNNHTGFSIEQIGELLDELQLQIVGPEQMVIDAEEYSSLKCLARKNLNQNEKS